MFLDFKFRQGAPGECNSIDSYTYFAKRDKFDQSDLISASISCSNSIKYGI